MPSCLGHKILGEGESRVIVLHDWYCDRSSWDPVLPYLTLTHFTYAFADLRGYGSSREMAGNYTLDEAVDDVMALADQLGWTRFSLIGHSMSSLVVQRIAQVHPDRVNRMVGVTPVAPEGMKCDDKTVEFFRSLALADDDTRFTRVAQFWGTRLSETWTRVKLRRWRETALPSAAAKYVELWGRADISEGARGLKTPVLIVCAAQDAPPFRQEALEKTMVPFYENVQLIALSESGHYPMQEQPPLLATLIERFLG